MARFLIATMPFVGHVNPGLPVARRLIERGHEVRWYTGRRFRERVEATGARWEPMRAAYDFDDRDLEASFPAREGLTDLAGLRFDLKHVFIDPIPDQIADLRAILREYPADAILADFTLGGVSLLHQLGEGRPWAALGHAILGIKSRDTAPYGLGLDPSSSPLGRLRNAALDWALNRVIFRDVNAHANAMRARLGLPTTRKGIFDLGLSPFLHLQATVPAFEYPRGDLPPQLHFIGPLLPPPAADFAPPAWWDDVRRGRPVVHVTQGTVATEADELIVPTLKGLAGEDLLVVATTGGKPVETVGLDPLPANARLASFIPHDRLLPHVDVMVTNGGYNGVQVALANGVPLVAGGQTEDKPEVCNRIAWSGAGIRLKSARPTPEQVRDAVRAILTDPRYQERARWLGAEIARHDAAGAAATLLERLAATGRPVLREDVAAERPATGVARVPATGRA